MASDPWKRPLRSRFVKRRKLRMDINRLAAVLLGIAVLWLIVFAHDSLLSGWLAMLFLAAAIALLWWNDRIKRYLDSHPPPEEEGRSP